MLSVSSAKLSVREQRHAHDAGVLNAGVEAIHVERRRANEDLVAPGRAEAADQDVDRLAAAARHEDLALLDAVVLGELFLQHGRPRRRVDVEPALRRVAGRTPWRLVRVEPNAAGLVRPGHVRPDAAQLGACQVEQGAHRRSPPAASRSLTAHACASSPSRRASVVAIGPDRAQAFEGQLLHGHRAQEVGDAEARVASREAVGRQHVVRAAAIVADRFRRPRPEKHRAGCRHLVEPRTRLLDLQDQVLRRIAVRDRERRIEIVDDDDARVRERALDELAARESRLLRRDGADHGPAELLARRHEQHLRIGAVLGLRQQVRGDERRVGAFVGDDEHLGRPRGIVARGTRGIAVDLRFGFGDPGVARAEDLVDLRHALGAVRHGRDRLRAAELEHALDAGDARRVEHGGVYAARRLHGAAEDPRRAARDARPARRA